METASDQHDEQPRRRLHLLYHELRPGGSRYSYVLDPQAFDRHLALVAETREKAPADLWPELTFDDGHISNYEIALPMLAARGLTARFFITAGWTGNRPNYLGPTELRALLASGQTIGAHGWSHTLLTHCSPRELHRELNGARAALEDTLGAEVVTMSLPGGRSNTRVLAACREAGYRQVFTSVPRAEPAASGFLVGRMNVRGDLPLDRLGRLLRPESGLLQRLERQARIKVAAQRLLGDRLYEALWSALNRREPESESETEAEEIAG